MKTQELYSKHFRVSSNYANVVMGVFMPVYSMSNQSKIKLFCDKIIHINQLISKDKRVLTYLL